VYEAPGEKRDQTENIPKTLSNGSAKKERSLFGKEGGNPRWDGGKLRNPTTKVQLVVDTEQAYLLGLKGDREI